MTDDTINSPRFFVISAERFDGSTPFSAGWNPARSALQPRMYATQEIVGRLNFSDLARPGTSGAVVLVRRWMGPAPDESVQVRAVAGSETTDVPPPATLDSLLAQHGLTTAWSAPMFLGPTDAIALNHIDGGTIELLVAEEQGQVLQTQLQLAALLEGDGCCTQTTIAVTGGAQQLGPWKGTLHVRATLTGTPISGLQLQLPDADDLVIPCAVVIYRDGGDPFTVVGDGDNVNGAAAPPGITFAHNHMAVRFELTSGGWDATYPILSMIPTTVDDSGGPSPAIPTWEGDGVFNINLAGAGAAILPARNKIATDQKAYIYSRGAEAVITVGVLGDFINGSDVSLRLPARGDSALFVADGQGGWRAIRDTMGLYAAPTFSAGNVVHATGWRGRKAVIQTGAAAATQTLPAVSTTPLGCTLICGSTGAGGTTISVQDLANDLIIGLGASATSVTHVQNVIRRYEYLGPNGAGKNVWCVT